MVNPKSDNEPGWQLFVLAGYFQANGWTVSLSLSYHGRHNSFWHLNSVCACGSQTRVCMDTYIVCKCANYCLFLHIFFVLFLIGGAQGVLQPIPAVSMLMCYTSFSHTLILKLESPIGVHVGAAQLKKRRTKNLKQECWGYVPPVWLFVDVSTLSFLYYLLLKCIRTQCTLAVLTAIKSDKKQAWIACITSCNSNSICDPLRWF